MRNNLMYLMLLNLIIEYRINNINNYFIRTFLFIWMLTLLRKKETS